VVEHLPSILSAQVSIPSTALKSFLQTQTNQITKQQPKKNPQKTKKKKNPPQHPKVLYEKEPAVAIFHFVCLFGNAGPWS
jgi:hypothetical protein